MSDELRDLLRGCVAENDRLRARIDAALAIEPMTTPQYTTGQQWAKCEGFNVAVRLFRSRLSGETP